MKSYNISNTYNKFVQMSKIKCKNTKLEKNEYNNLSKLIIILYS